MSWSDTFLALLKDNDIRLIGYVPDNVLTPLIKGVGADNYFMPVNATREDEAIGTVTGAYMAGLRGAVMMQTSGFALIANALASLVLPYQIPLVMAISETARWENSTSASLWSRARCGRRSTRLALRITRSTTKRTCRLSSTLRSSRPMRRKRRSPSFFRRYSPAAIPPAEPN
jgi:hypothetical protein